MSCCQIWLLLLIVFGLFYLVLLSNYGLWIFDEICYVQISQVMLLGGDWVLLYFFGLCYFEKLVVGYWMIVFGQVVFGENLFGVCIVLVVVIVFSVLFVYLLVCCLWCDLCISLVCVLFYVSFGLIVGQFGYVNFDL